MIFSRIGRKPTQDFKIMNTLFPAAEAVARADGLDALGAEHLLVAAFGLEDGSAQRAFERVGVDPFDFGGAVRAQHSEALGGVGITGVDDSLLDRHLPEPPASIRPLKTKPSAHALFRAVVDMVREDTSQLYSAYFVLAATQTQHGTTIRAIRHLGIEPTELAAAARAEIDALIRPAT